MRIATWNLERCSPNTQRASRINEYLSNINADVWVLTETYRDFAPGPEYHLVDYSADANDRQAVDGECWVAVWSRLPSQSVRLTADLERVAAARVGDVTIVGTVLPWLVDKRNGITGSAEFSARLKDQLVDWKRLRNESTGLCVTGDFNQDLLTTGHYYGSRDGRNALRMALKQVGLECLTADSNDPLAESGLACIDHICVGGLRTTGTAPSSVWPNPGKLNSNISDHYGVFTNLEVLNSSPL